MARNLAQYISLCTAVAVLAAVAGCHGPETASVDPDSAAAIKGAPLTAADQAKLAAAAIYDQEIRDGKIKPPPTPAAPVPGKGGFGN
jgi:hypothetical protein